jgi:hypothetical protein
MNYREVVENGLELINLTPHEIKVLDADFSVGPSKDINILRIQKSSLLQGSIMDCNIFSINEEIYGPVPEFDKTKLYIVSQKVAEAMAVDPLYRDRTDFVYPINIEHEHIKKPLLDKYGKVVTDSKGEPMTIRQQKIKGCRGFEFPRREYD